MAASADHIKAMVRSHSSGDDEGFYSVALQVAAKAARQGHHRLAGDLKQLPPGSSPLPRWSLLLRNRVVRSRIWWLRLFLRSD